MGIDVRDVRGALREAMRRLHTAGVPSHALAAELLLMHTLGSDRTWLFTHPEQGIEGRKADAYFELVARRAAGTPVQHLTGKQEFWGLEFEVTPATLIPRPETEHVVEVALDWLGGERKSETLRIADVGTGSGCIAIALAKEFPRAEIFATDISHEALDVARRNAARHGEGGRIRFFECNLMDALAGDAQKFDLIASNPPYIGLGEEPQLPREVREHEPRVALFGGPTGVEIYPPLITQAAEMLRRSGALVVEMGFGGLERVRTLLGDTRTWTDIRVTPDLAGIPRIISAARA